VLIEGSIAEVGANMITIDTAAGSQAFTLPEGARLEDGFGNAIDLANLQPGQVVILTIRESDGALVPQHLEVKDRLFGTVLAIDGDTVRLDAGGIEYLIRLAPATEIEGNLQPGAFVEVEIDEADDGSLWAEEIEVEEDGHGEDDNSGPGGGDHDDEDDSGSGGHGDDDDNSGSGGGEDEDDSR
jgi:hypothetical protein